MHTPWGRSRFGISSTPEEFQCRLHDILCDIEGVVDIAADIITVGSGESLYNVHVDHDNTVSELLNWLSQHNLKLNPDKIKFKTCIAPFMGHVLGPKGLKPSTQITNAVVNIPQPRTRQPLDISWAPLLTYPILSQSQWSGSPCPWPYACWPRVPIGRSAYWSIH